MLAHEYKVLSSKVLVFIVLCYMWISKLYLYLRFCGTNLISNMFALPQKLLKHPETLKLHVPDSFLHPVTKQK